MGDFHLPYELLSLLAVVDLVLAVAGSWLVAFVICRLAHYPWWIALTAALVPVAGAATLLSVAAVTGRLHSAGRRPHRDLWGWLAVILVVLGLLSVIAGCLLPLLSWHGQVNEQGYRVGEHGTVSLLEFPAAATVLIAIIVAALTLTIGLLVRGGVRFAVPLLMVCTTGLLASVTTLLLALAISDLADSVQRLTLERAQIAVDAGLGAWVLIVGWVLLTAGATLHCLQASATSARILHRPQSALTSPTQLPSLPPAPGNLAAGGHQHLGQHDDPFRQEDGF